MLQRSISACLTATLALALTPTASARTEVRTTRVASGLSFPVYVTHAPGDLDRIFIAEKLGVIKVMDLASGGISVFLDISARVGAAGSTNDERGLLGLAFHPAYASNGFFYVDYTDTSSDTVVSRFSVIGDPATSNSADPTSESILLAIDQPQVNHNGGWLGFGPADGYLYIGTGDGGNFCDVGPGHTATIGNAQDITENLLGKILRIDVDGGSPYAIPATNPFVGVTGDDEIWARGLRNPYRCSFDRMTGDFYIGDVGQDVAEEIDYQPAGTGAGLNYGWSCREGNNCATESPSNCAAIPSCTCPSPTPTLTDPIYAFTHNPPPSPAGFVCSIIGGYVYRGTCIPELDGTYFLSDFCGSPAIWSFEVVGGTLMNFQTRSDLTPSLQGVNVNSVVSFGEDARGEIYIVDLGNGSNGNIFKIVPLAAVATRNQAPNPGSYVASPAVLGGTLTALVDNNTAGQATSLLFAFDTPTAVPLASGQVLLAIDSGSGELLTGAGLAPVSSVGGLDSYSLAIPNDLDLCGQRMYSQAIQFGNPPFDLSNAQDLNIGY